MDHNTLLRRRGFLGGALAASPVSASAAAPASEGATAGGLPDYARVLRFKSAKQSSCNKTGANADRWSVPAGQSIEIFNAEGPGAITHIWFTMGPPASNASLPAAPPSHLKDLVLRAYWDGSEKPSVEAPIGDFFGLNLGHYFLYESAFTCCAPERALNCYFSMPYRKSARLTVSNEGRGNVGAFFSNIDYVTLASWPGDALYFHAQYRQQAPCDTSRRANENLDAAGNYVFVEARGSGHLLGVTLGVRQNAEAWMGEGDDMTFLDGEARPVIYGTGLEDYFLGSYNFGGRYNPKPFAYAAFGAPYIAMAEQSGGRYCCYRWHVESPLVFSRYLKHTIEHGHGNGRADNYCSVAYWYQTEPFIGFPALPAAGERRAMLLAPAEVRG